MFCKQCGSEILDAAIVCVNCGVATGAAVPAAEGSKDRIAYILLGVFIGVFGIHNFFAGYTGRGIAQLLITLLTGWLFVPLVIVWVWVIVEICTVTKDAQNVPFK